MTKAELAAKAREKWPQYANVPDDQLANAMITKFPQYASLIDEDTKAAPGATATPAGAPGMLSGLKNVVQGVPGTISGMLRGVDKAALGAASGAGEMVHKIPGVSSAVDALFGTPGLSKNAFAEARRATAPQGVAEKVGKFAGDVGMMAVAPEAGPGASLLKTALTSGAGSAAMTGVQTGGRVPAMAASGALGAAAPLVGKGLEKVAGSIRTGQAAPVAAARTAKAAKAAGESMNDPKWMAAAGINKQEFTDLIKKFGLTGGEDDLAIIQAAPAHRQEVLSALSNQLSNFGKGRPFGHTWSLLQAASLLGGAATGHPLEGAGIALPLAAMGVAHKFPGQTAKALSAAAPAVEGAVRGVGGAAITELTPMEQELLKRSFGAHAEP